MNFGISSERIYIIANILITIKMPPLRKQARKTRLESKLQVKSQRILRKSAYQSAKIRRKPSK